MPVGYFCRQIRRCFLVRVRGVAERLVTVLVSIEHRVREEKEGDLLRYSPPATGTPQFYRVVLFRNCVAELPQGRSDLLSRCSLVSPRGVEEDLHLTQRTSISNTRFRKSSVVNARSHNGIDLPICLGMPRSFTNTTVKKTDRNEAKQ